MRTLTQVFERIILKRRTDGLYDTARGLTAHQEHLHLIEAMKRRDATQAVGILRAHIREGKDNVLGDLLTKTACPRAAWRGGFRPIDLLV
jgi:DNA-binding GntR family transcriptional regulator